MSSAQLRSRWLSIVGDRALSVPDRSWAKELPIKAMCPLDRLGLLRVSGPQAQEFLDRLVTCKVEAPSSRPQFCSLCNPKGRILSCFNLFYIGNDIYLQMPYELVDVTLQRLQIYVLMSQVEIRDASADLLGIGYIGSPPSAVPEGSLLWRALTNHPCYFTYVEAEQAQTMWQRGLAEAYTPAAYDAWHYCTLRAQIANIYLPTMEKLIPQMINLERFGGLSFSKGCYPGQEIIARTHYRGRSKRGCYLFSAATAGLKVADPVYHPLYNDACGLIVDCYAVDPNYTLGLISIRKDVCDKPGLYIKGDDNSHKELQIDSNDCSSA